MLIVSYKISLQDLIYYFFHLITLKHLKDLNMMFLHYLLLLLFAIFILLWISLTFNLESNEMYSYCLVFYFSFTNVTVYFAYSWQNGNVLFVWSHTSDRKSKFLYWLAFFDITYLIHWWLHKHKLTSLYPSKKLFIEMLFFYKCDCLFCLFLTKWECIVKFGKKEQTLLHLYKQLFDNKYHVFPCKNMSNATI
jgi:hypothetical protein